MASFQTAPTFFTVLDVVNMCLRSIGTDQVDTIEDNEDADVMAILSELNRADLSIQSNSGDGWGWNTNNSLLLPLGTDGTIDLPDQTLFVCTAYLQNAYASGSVNRVVERPTGKLYDAYNHTGIFSAPQLVDLVIRMDFETIPQVARDAIGTKGAYMFQAQYNGGQILTQVTSKEVNDTWAVLCTYDDGNNTQNALNANKGQVARLYGQGGLRRNRGGQ